MPNDPRAVDDIVNVQTHKLALVRVRYFVTPWVKVQRMIAKRAGLAAVTSKVSRRERLIPYVSKFATTVPETRVQQVFFCKEPLVNRTAKGWCNKARRKVAIAAKAKDRGWAMQVWIARPIVFRAGFTQLVQSKPSHAFQPHFEVPLS